MVTRGQGKIMKLASVLLAGVIAIGVSNCALARGGGGHSGHSATSTHSSSSSSSDHTVRAYTKTDGTYVPQSHATNPNSTRNDNYSTRGNVNPYTGKEGTKPRDGAY